MIWLGVLNFLVLQWFGVRLARVRQRVLMGDHPSCYRHVRWTLLRWIVPLTGWWSDFAYITKRRLARLLQFVTNVHRIHHIRWSYGYTFRPLPWAYFPAFRTGPRRAPGELVHYGWKRIKPSEFHDCTWTGRY